MANKFLWIIKTQLANNKIVKILITLIIQKIQHKAINIITFKAVIILTVYKTSFNPKKMTANNNKICLVIKIMLIITNL